MASRAHCATIMAAVSKTAAVALKFQHFCLAILLMEIEGFADPMASIVATDLLADSSLACRRFRRACFMFLGSASLVCSSVMLLLP